MASKKAKKKTAPKKKAKSKAKKKAAPKAKKKAKAKPAPKAKGKAKAAPKGPKPGKKKPPRDPTPVDDKSKGPRVVATVVLCGQCGEPNQVPTSTTATGITTKCARCENVIRVSGAKLAKLRVARDSIRECGRTALLPFAQGPTKPGKGEGKGRAPEYQVLRFRCTAEQYGPISTALEVARRMCNEEGKDWNARSLELICGDFLSGAPAEVVAKVQEEKGTTQGAAANATH